MQQIVGGIWKKEGELKQLKSEVAALERKIQLELTLNKPETEYIQADDQTKQTQTTDKLRENNSVSGDTLQTESATLSDADFHATSSFAREHIHLVKPIITDKTHISTKGLKLG